MPWRPRLAEILFPETLTIPCLPYRGAAAVSSTRARLDEAGLHGRRTLWTPARITGSVCCYREHLARSGMEFLRSPRALKWRYGSRARHPTQSVWRFFSWCSFLGTSRKLSSLSGASSRQKTKQARREGPLLPWLPGPRPRQPHPPGFPLHSATGIVAKAPRRPPRLGFRGEVAASDQVYSCGTPYPRRIAAGESQPHRPTGQLRWGPVGHIMPDAPV